MDEAALIQRANEERKFCIFQRKVKVKMKLFDRRKIISTL